MYEDRRGYELISMIGGGATMLIGGIIVAAKGFWCPGVGLAFVGMMSLTLGWQLRND